MPDGLSGEEQAVYFSKVRRFFDSYACSRIMEKRSKTMSDYICKQVAIEKLNYAYRCGADIDRYGLSTALDVIDEIESADIVPVRRGKWMKEDRGHVEYCAVCDQCGFDWMWSDRGYFKFCPNCGAKMDGKGEE